MERLTALTISGSLEGVVAITKPSEVFYYHGTDMWKDEKGHLLTENQLIGRLCKDMGMGYTAFLNGDTIMLCKNVQE